MWVGLVYSTQQVADTLKIGRSTVNKYARSLEDEGYNFKKGENDRRAFTEHDLIMFRALVDLLDRGVQYDSAISTIALRYNTNQDAHLPVAVNEPNTAQLGHVEAQLEAVMSAISSLSDRVDCIIDERVKHEVAVATEQLNTQIAELSDQLRESQDVANEKLDTVLSRLDRYERLPWWKFWRK